MRKAKTYIRAKYSKYLLWRDNEGQSFGESDESQQKGLTGPVDLAKAIDVKTSNAA